MTTDVPAAVLPDELPEQYRGWKRCDLYPPERFDLRDGQYVQALPYVNTDAYLAAKYQVARFFAPDFSEGIAVMFLREEADGAPPTLELCA